MKRNGTLLVAATLLVCGCTHAAPGDHLTAPSGAITSVHHRLTLDPDKDYGNRYADGVLPVGDGKYKVDEASKGYFDACSQYATSLESGTGGAGTRGPWFSDDGTEYDADEKAHVQGSVDWDSSFSIRGKGDNRVITMNDLPSHPTGEYPISSDDPAYAYDRNPNSIGARSIKLTLPASPSYGKPHCAGGEVGVMTTGVVLFNAFDAGGRDAGAWEVQDNCAGHPNQMSEYHYHTTSSCLTHRSVHRVVGWAFDGFPLTGPKVDPHNILTTSDLDKCHGITSNVKINGERVKTYHYVMTQDFPYSVSCFRATPVTVAPV